MTSPIEIPPHLAKEHAAPLPGESASDSALRIGRGWVSTFVELGGLHGRARVLDVGCGPGRMAITVGERFGWTNPYLGFDIAPADIEFATRAITSIHPGFVFRHLDVRNDYYNPHGRLAAERATFPAADATFDFAFATSVFTHFFTAELRRYLAEAHRCLAPGGAFLSSWFLLDAVSRAGMREPGSRLDFGHRIDAHAVAHNPRKPGKAVAYATEFARTALHEAGFADVVHHRGTWSGTPGRHSQDVVVARRA